KRWKRFASMCGFLILGLDCAAIVALLLIQFGGLEMEWRGGYVPVLTWRKTKPDFNALARRRAQQKTRPGMGVADLPDGGNWPGFRGGRRDGTYNEQPILTNWPADGLRLRWKQPCGGGYSSYAMVDSRAFTIEQRRDMEVVVAYDIETGRELWTNGW